MDGVELELKECGSERMEKKSLERIEWAPAMKETKAKFHGCSENNNNNNNNNNNKD